MTEDGTFSCVVCGSPLFKLVPLYSLCINNYSNMFSIGLRRNMTLDVVNDDIMIRKCAHKCNLVEYNIYGTCFKPNTNEF